MKFSSETTRNYLCYAYIKATEDLKEAKALAPYRDDKNVKQIADLKLVLFDLKNLIAIMDT